MADPLFELHKAYYAALKAALTPIGVELYDNVPSTDVTHPYVVIERHVSANADFLNNRKDRVFTYLTVFSTYRGQKEVLTVMETMYEALHQKQLTLDAGRMVRCFVDSRDTSRDMDGLTYMGQVSTYAVIEHS